VLQRHKEPTTLLREQERWSAVLSRLSVDDVVLAARLNALGDVRIDRLGSGRVFVHVRSRSEKGGRPWLVLEAATGTRQRLDELATAFGRHSGIAANAILTSANSAHLMSRSGRGGRRRAYREARCFHSSGTFWSYTEGSEHVFR
jgi:hypothetical protein